MPAESGAEYALRSQRRLGVPVVADRRTDAQADGHPGRRDEDEGGREERIAQVAVLGRHEGGAEGQALEGLVEAEGDGEGAHDARVVGRAVADADEDAVEDDASLQRVRHQRCLHGASMLTATDVNVVENICRN